MTDSNVAVIKPNKDEPNKGVILHAMNDFVIVVPIPDPEITKSGLFIPETTAKATRRGQIVGIGPGMYDGKGRRKPLGLKMYEEVLIGGWVGTEIKIDGQLVLILRAEDIIAIIDNGDEIEVDEIKGSVE